MSALDNLKRELARIEEPDYGRLHDLVKSWNLANQALVKQQRLTAEFEKHLAEASKAVEDARLEASHIRTAIKALEAASGDGADS